MDRGLRTKDFKMGCIHGKLDAKDKNSEAHIQRKVFQGQRLEVCRAREDTLIIRLIGYEVPIENVRRGRCVDLMGYDADYNLYLIELKKGQSNEKMGKIISQIDNYTKSVKKILRHIEREFKETFFFPIKFSSIKKMILAPREFYTKKKHFLSDDSIDYGYYRVKDIKEAELGEITRVHLRKK